MKGDVLDRKRANDLIVQKSLFRPGGASRVGRRVFIEEGLSRFNYSARLVSQVGSIEGNGSK